MASRKDDIIQKLTELDEAVTANQLSELLSLDRANVSRYLNELNKEGLVEKSTGRPVLYKLVDKKQQKLVNFESLVGYDTSLKTAIQKAKAAILYPPRGLHTLLFGETGTGKSLFAECMYQYAKSSEMLGKDAPFISFNCADYAQNPQLLFAHIFGVKKGAFTGAEQDNDGLVAQADGGILFLDEIHRLPPEGQEMLFTFIDKGVYRPLGESQQTHEASVQIIGATTEKSSNFLTTFNRRIPMAIELPPLRERTLEERFEIATYFLQIEANRLNIPVIVERDAILSLMTYPVEANVGQVKKDIKLISAKAFLKYQMQQTKEVVVEQSDLPLNIQKGLLVIKQNPDKMSDLIANLKSEITFLPGGTPAELFPTANVTKQTFAKEWPSAHQLSYFKQYVDELQEAVGSRYQINSDYQKLAQKLYKIAEEKLDRIYSEREVFAFALHLQLMFERIANNEELQHPDLTSIRKSYLTEFQVAMELSQYIESYADVSMSMDEIGFLTMFLALPEHQMKSEKNKVHVILLMHGKHTATSVLQTAQELLGTHQGIAFDMDLQVDVLEMYKQVVSSIKTSNYKKDDSILLLADMGSLTRFGDMLQEELRLNVKTIPMATTSVVMEALRLSSQGYSLEEIYQNVLQAMSTIIDQHELPVVTDKPKAIIVTCFTGEGVASKLNDRVREIINPKQYEIIQMQFLEHNTFRRHIDDMQKKYDIKAIVGTVAMHYQNIPYFSVIDIFDDEQVKMFKRVLEDVIPVDDLIQPLEESLDNIDDIKGLLQHLRKQVHGIQNDLGIFVESNVEAGIILHLAFLIDKLKKGLQKTPTFDNLTKLKKQHKLAFDVVTTQLLPLERTYEIELSDDDRAYITQMIMENRLDSEYVKPNLIDN